MTVIDRKWPEVVIIGGGFGGLNAAKGLLKTHVFVLLVDKHNYHVFQPLLYQVATAALAEDNIAVPIRSVLRKQKNTRVGLADIVGVDLERKVIFGPRGEKSFDYLVIASGLEGAYFGHDEFRVFAPSLKSLDDAAEIRRRILMAFEEAEFEVDEESRRGKLTFVVVGGGPTGVELSGAIMEIAKYTLPEEFRYIDTHTARVILVQGGDRLLGGMPPAMGERALKDLEQMGVEVRFNQYVTHVDDEGVMIGDDRVPAENVIWAAGVQGTPLVHTLGVELDRAGRVIVEPDLTIPGSPQVFVIGDAAHVVDPKTGEPVPAVAQGAIQMGQYVAKLIHAEVNGASDSQRPAFSYHDKGSMATIGRGKAVSFAYGRLFAGFIGWLMWGLVHILFLIGFHNKMTVFLEWMWTFLRFERGSRLITGDPKVKIKEVRGVTMIDEELQRNES